MIFDEIIRLSFTFVILINLCSANLRLPLSSNDDDIFVISADKREEANYRLSGDVSPTKYEITITPNLEEWTFKGHVIIHIKAQAEHVQKIILHAKDLTIENIKVHATEDPCTDLHEGEEYYYENVTQLLTIPTNHFLSLDYHYYVEIEYTGSMQGVEFGFFRATYKEKGVEKRLGATNLQPNYARRVFPCFDEPKFKAIFELKLLRTDQYHTLANMRQKETGVLQKNGLYLDSYESTPLMSTYLVAFVISEYTCRHEDGDRLRVWTRPDMYEATEFAYEFGKKSLEVLNEFTAIDYFSYMPKMDMVSVPYLSGAMENWGLLIYEEALLLNIPDKTTTFDKQKIAIIIAHEQAHMWFGNLVTCDWWQYTWLNEGFATYFSYLATHSVNNSWEMDFQLRTLEIQTAFLYDSQNYTNAMSGPVVTSADIANKFNWVSYNKGAAVIHMIQHLIGFDEFRAGIRQYLANGALSTATPAHLYTAWQSNAKPGIDIAAILSSWTDQKGYPVLTVEMNENRTVAKLSQRRFISTHPTHNETTVYTIPVTFATPTKGFSNDTHSLLLETKEGELEIPNGDSWVIFNVQQIGFYRVNYDELSWKLIQQGLNKSGHDGIHKMNRAQIIDDAMNLARGGLLDYQIVFDILDYLAFETECLAWTSAIKGLEYLDERMADKHSELFGGYVKKLFQNIYSHLGFTAKSSDRESDILNRENVLHWMCKFDHKDCVAKAKAEFKRTQEDESYLVPVDIRKVVYCMGAKYGGKDAYEWLWNKLATEQFVIEKRLIRNAIDCVVDEEVFSLHLNNIYSTDVQGSNKYAPLLAYYSYSEEKMSLVMAYIERNQERIVKNFSISSIEEYIWSSRPRNTDYQLYWDSQYLAKIVSIMEKKVHSGAADQTPMNVFIIVLGMAINVIAIRRK